MLSYVHDGGVSGADLSNLDEPMLYHAYKWGSKPDSGNASKSNKTILNSTRRAKVPHRDFGEMLRAGGRLWTAPEQ